MFRELSAGIAASLRVPRSCSRCLAPALHRPIAGLTGMLSGAQRVADDASRFTESRATGSQLWFGCGRRLRVEDDGRGGRHAGRFRLDL
jgi:hypothetical protein